MGLGTTLISHHRGLPAHDAPRYRAALLQCVAHFTLPVPGTSKDIVSRNGAVQTCRCFISGCPICILALLRQGQTTKRRLSLMQPLSLKVILVLPSSTERQRGSQSPAHLSSGLYTCVERYKCFLPGKCSQELIRACRHPQKSLGGWRGSCHPNPCYLGLIRALWHVSLTERQWPRGFILHSLTRRLAPAPLLLQAGLLPGRRTCPWLLHGPQSWVSIRRDQL